MRKNSQVNAMREDSQVKEMWGNSQVNVMWGNSQVKEMWGNSITRCLGSNTVKCYGYNYIFVQKGSEVINIELNETSQIIYFDTFRTKPCVEFYLKNYVVKKKDENTLIMYKAVHKINGEYLSNYDKTFKYVLGEDKHEQCSEQNDNSCDVGIHISDLMFAVNFGRSFDGDFVILECEVPIDKIIVSKDCDGKVRSSIIKPIRELSKEEYEIFVNN